MKRSADTIKKIGINTAFVYGAMFVGILLSAALFLIIPGAGQTSTTIGKLMDPPFWLPEVLCGAVVGWLAQKRFAISLPALALIIPSLLLCLDVLLEGLPMRTYTPLVDIYFSSDSGATEGLYKLTFVAPLYTAVAFTVGALAAKLLNVR